MRQSIRTPLGLGALFGLLAVAAIATTLLAIPGGAATTGGVRAARSQTARVPLVVYSAQGYDMNEIKAFQRATGIKTELICDSTGPLLARIEAERNNPQWGLLWVDGNQPFAALDKQGLMLRGFEPAVAWNAVGQKVLPCGPSRFLVLLGPSGSGKTTLLRSIAGIERITGGAIRIGDELVADGRLHVPPERRDLARVFQDYALWPHMTSAQNVAYALRRRRLDADTTRRRTQAMLDRVGLGRLAHRYPSELSGGEQQRVALARALVANTGLLLFDEPLSNLDADLRERLRVEIATLVREFGPTVVYITHDQSEAFALADEIGILQHGRLIQVGTPETIYRDPATAFVARFTGLAGEIAVHAGPVIGEGLVTVSVDGTTLAARLPRPVAVGTPARMMIRPSAGTLCRVGGEAPHLRGQIRDVAFCGRGYEHVVDLGDGSRLHGLFSEARWSRGDHIGVALDPEGCLVLDEEPIRDDEETPNPALATSLLPAAPAVEEQVIQGIP